MGGVPTYVIGAGQVGCEVVSRLADCAHTDDRFGLLAVDADPDTLDRMPSSIQTIQLTSDSGVVGEPIKSYPYLSADVRIPATDANGQRHVGRYKLDNPIGTPFQNHLDTIRRRIDRFYQAQLVGLDDGSERTCQLVLVAALGGGTGSGVVPLLAAALDHVGASLEYEEEVDVHVLGVGVVPPLNFDLRHEPTPVEPVSYPNTYGALRNLSTLLGASDADPVDVPVYSSVASVGGRATDDASGVAQPGTVFQLERSPFDAYWLVGADHGRTVGRRTVGRDAVPTMVAKAIHALSAYAAADVDHAVRSRTSDIPPLGALGYAALAVPHRRLRAYCEHRQERERLEEEREGVVDRNIAELRDEHTTLVAALEQAEDGARDGWLARIRPHLDTNPETPADLLDAGPDAIAAALDGVANEADPGTYLRTISGASDGLADACADVRSAVEQTCRSVREGHEFEPAVDGDWERLSTVERVAALERTIRERIEMRRERLPEVEPNVRDLLPPVIGAFTGERDRLQAALDRLQAALDRLDDASERIEKVRTVEALLRARSKQARERVRSRLDDIERDIEHFRQKRDELRDALDDLDREIASLRRALTDPASNGPTFVCPLRRSALSEVTLDTVESELTSIAAYRERGFLAVDDEGLERLLADCHECSRDWPASVAQRERAVSPASDHDLTVVLYHRANESCVTDFVESVTTPDALQTSAQSEFEYTTDPFRIEIVALAHGEQPASLTGVRRLEEMASEGLFEAIGHPYRDYRRALAYPEWYDDIAGPFD
jgi:hypothetical protein